MRNKLVFLFFLAILTMVPCVAGEAGPEAGNLTVPEDFTPYSGIQLKEPPEEALIVPPMPQSTPHWELWLVLAVVIIGINTFMFIRLKRKKAGFLTALILLAMLSSFPSVFAYDYGAPLETGGIAFFAYYNETTDWTLTDTTSGWQEYTDNGNYYDGIVRVWQDASGDDYNGADTYIDVCCRVRADGWILTWLNQSQDAYGDYPYYGKDRSYSGDVLPIENATSLARAMERIYYSAGKTFCGYEEINYYDYQWTDTEQLMWFGSCARDSGGSGTNEYFWFIIPDGVTLEQALFLWGGYVDNAHSTGSLIRLYFNGTLEVNENGLGDYGYTYLNITDISVGTHYESRLYADSMASKSKIIGTISLWLS